MRFETVVFIANQNEMRFVKTNDCTDLSLANQSMTNRNKYTKFVSATFDAAISLANRNVVDAKFANATYAVTL